MSRNKDNEEEQRSRDEGNFNQGRQSADSKWISAIDERIVELEKLAGIPELKQLKKETMYRWKD